ncbi:MAG: DEAD/DEAH box helicase, partial [Ferruginibacter sp.]
MKQAQRISQKNNLKKSLGYQVIEQWLMATNKHPFLFQQQTWVAISEQKSGLVNAPTGSGKTYSVFLGAIIQFINQHPKDYHTEKNNGLQLLWITPLRALAKDIARAMDTAISALGMAWEVGIRNGDTSTNERAKQKRQMPEILIITPESLHLLLAQKNYPKTFKTLQTIAVDEWHELLGSKRGVQVELAMSRLVGLQLQYNTANANNKTTFTQKKISIWGISATIGNLEEAMEVLMAPLQTKGNLIKAAIKKKISIASIIPTEMEKYPWSGHLGIKMADQILPILHQHHTTLVFINTRGMSEVWYQHLLNIDPSLAGAIALLHGSIEPILRLWVEDALHTGTLLAVVCTSSLDLGVDFRPVETVIQVGSPKGVARFLQRAGRSGHQPNAESKIWFLPTHSLELLEAAALKESMEQMLIESRMPFTLCFDVLLQYLCTLAISEGFDSEVTFEEVKNTFCYKEITREEWNQLLQFLTNGGKALQQYDDFKKVEIIDGIYKINNKRLAMRHRMHIGTIVSDAMMKVKFIGGGFLGVIEEWFISRLQPGDVFTLAGKNLKFVV